MIFRSAKSCSSAKSITASRRRATSFGVRPIITPLRTTFSRAGQLRVEADAELDERGEPAGDLDPARVGAVDAGEQFQQRALARAVAADDAEELALADLEGDPVERAQLAVLARRERVDGPLFQRVDPLGRDAEGLMQVFDPDRWGRVGSWGAGYGGLDRQFVVDGHWFRGCSGLPAHLS